MIKLTALAAVLLTTLTGCGSTPNITSADPWAASYHACMDQTGGDVDTCADAPAGSYSATTYATPSTNDNTSGPIPDGVFKTLSILGNTMMAVGATQAANNPPPPPPALPQTITCRENTNQYTGTTITCQ